MTNHNRRQTDIYTVVSVIQTIVLIIGLTALMITVSSGINSYQDQNKSYQKQDLCMKKWLLDHRQDNKKYNMECEDATKRQ